MTTIEQLRENAKLNMDAKSYSYYLETIEPSIKAMIRDYLKSWKDLDNLITKVTMRTRGAYTTNFDVLFSKGEDKTKLKDRVNISIYNKVDRMKLDKKIKYLHDVGLLGNSTFDLLDYLRQRRNLIHGIDEAFSDIERIAFNQAHSILFWKYTVTDKNFPNPEQKDEIAKGCEVQASYLLKELKQKLSK